MIRFACAYCTKQLKAPAALSGRSAACPKCGRANRVPTSSPAPVAAPDDTAEEVSALPTAAAPAPLAKPQPPAAVLICPRCDYHHPLPAEMAGMKAECPKCLALAEVVVSLRAAGEPPAVPPPKVIDYRPPTLAVRDESADDLAAVFRRRREVKAAARRVRRKLILVVVLAIACLFAVPAAVNRVIEYRKAVREMERDRPPTSSP